MVRFAQPMPNSFITALGYNPETRELTVYIHGKPYRYGNVSQSKFDRFRKSPAPGTFYVRLIKEKVEEHPRLDRQKVGAGA